MFITVPPKGFKSTEGVRTVITMGTLIVDVVDIGIRPIVSATTGCQTPATGTTVHVIVYGLG